MNVRAGGKHSYHCSSKFIYFQIYLSGRKNKLCVGTPVSYFVVPHTAGLADFLRANPSQFRAVSGTVPKNRPRQLPSASFPIHQTRIVPLWRYVTITVDKALLNREGINKSVSDRTAGRTVSIYG